MREVRGRISINSRSMDSSGTERGRIIIESQYDGTLSREMRHDLSGWIVDDQTADNKDR